MIGDGLRGVWGTGMYEELDAGLNEVLGARLYGLMMGDGLSWVWGTGIYEELDAELYEVFGTAGIYEELGAVLNEFLGSELYTFLSARSNGLIADGLLGAWLYEVLGVGL